MALLPKVDVVDRSTVRRPGTNPDERLNPLEPGYR